MASPSRADLQNSLAKGKTFQSAADVEGAVRALFAADKTRFVTANVNAVRATYLCAAPNCKWRVCASHSRANDESNGEFIITRSSLGHKPDCQSDTAHQRAPRNTVSVIADIVAPIIRRKPNTAPSDMVEIAEGKGHPITNEMARRAKELAFTNIYGDDADAYARLSAYFSELKEKNEGLYFDLAVEEDEHGDVRFKRLFFCLPAAAGGIAHCLPLVGLDGDSPSCTCKMPRLRRLPCRHLCACTNAPEALIPTFYRASALKQAYFGTTQLPFSKFESDGTLPPLVLKNRRGRKQLKRTRSTGEVRALKCSNCHNVGHNKRKCPNPNVVQTPTV